VKTGAIRTNYLRTTLGTIILAGLLLSCTAAAAPFAYITNYGNGTVSVIDTATNLVTIDVSVGSQPFGVAVTPDGTKVYVTNYGANTVSVIKTADNSVTTPATVGSKPVGVAVSPDGSKAYVVNSGGKSVSVINTADNSVAATVTVGTLPIGIAVSPDGSNVYVANEGTKSVSVINTSDNSVAATVTVGIPAYGVSVSPDGSKLYVTSFGGKSVSVINTTDNSIAANVTVANSPEGIVVSPDNSKVYVVNAQSDNVSVINTADNSVAATVTVGNQPQGVAVSPDGSNVYVVNTLGNSVSVINTADNSVTTPVTGLSTPRGFGQFIIPPAATTTPVITTPVYAGATSVTGTATAGASIVLKINGVRQTAVTATGGTWTVTVPALATTDTLSATAWLSPNRMSAPVTATVTAAPTPTPTPTPTPASQSDGGSDNSNQAPAAPGVPGTISVNVGGTTSVTGVTVTGTGVNGLIVTSVETSGPGTGIPPPPGILNAYVDITPARYTTITGAQISFFVPQSWLDEHQLTQQEIVLYHNVGNGWQALPTTFVNSKSGENYYTATSPGFSRYAITGQLGLAGGSNVTASPTVLTIGDIAKSSTITPPTSAATMPAQTPKLTPTVLVTSTTPAAAPDTIPVLGALVLCGAIFLFKKN